MTIQQDHVDLQQGGDTGQDNVDAVQPVTDGEGATQTVLRRPSENLRGRTEVLRSTTNDLLYYRDSGHMVIEGATGHTITWPGSTTAASTGVIAQVGNLTVRPLLTPASSTKATLSFGVSGTDRVVYTVVASAYATMGMNAVTVEQRDGGVGSAHTCTITDGPVKRILVVFDLANVAHDSAATKVIVDAAVALDTDLAGLITVTSDGLASDTIVVGAETRLEGTADQEAHLLPSGLLDTLTTTQPLAEGDAVGIWYRYVIEPGGAAGDPLDPKGGVFGGRQESNPDRATHTIPLASLFITSTNPNKIPGAVPLCKVVNNELVWFDGSRFVSGATGPMGTTSGLYIDDANFNGVKTNVGNGGISTPLAPASVQEAFDRVDDLLGNLRAFTYVCTDGTASTGGDFNGATAVQDAITTLGGAGGSICVRRGTYNLAVGTYVIPSNVTLYGENETNVIFDTATVVQLADNVHVYNIGFNVNIVEVPTTSSNGYMVGCTNTGAFYLEGTNWTYLNLESTDTNGPSFRVYGTGQNISQIRSLLRVELEGTSNRFDTVTVGNGSGDTTSSSIICRGTHNYYQGLRAEARNANLSTAGYAVIHLEGTQHIFDGITTDQTSGSIGTLRAGLRIQGLTDSKITNAQITMGAGYALSIRMGGVPNTGVVFTNSKFSHNNVVTADYLVQVIAGHEDNHGVSFEDTVFDSNETLAVNRYLMNLRYSATSRQTWNFTRCRFIGSSQNGPAGSWADSTFNDCTFQIKNPMSGGVRQLGGTNTGQTEQIWVFTASPAGTYSRVYNCTFDMMDSEVAVSGSGQPDIGVPLILYLANASEMYSSRIINMNNHVNSSGTISGLVYVAGGILDGLYIYFTNTAAIQAGAAALECLCNTILGHISRVAMVGNVPVTANFISIAVPTTVHVRDINFSNSTGQLINGLGGSPSLIDCTFTRCLVGSSTAGIANTTGMKLLESGRTRYRDCTWFLEGTSNMIEVADAVSLNLLFDGCTWIQNNAVAAAGNEVFSAVGPGSTVGYSRFTGCMWQSTQNGVGTRAFSVGVNFLNTVGAGNIYLWDGGAGTEGLPPFFASINSW